MLITCNQCREEMYPSVGKWATDHDVRIRRGGRRRCRCSARWLHLWLPLIADHFTAMAFQQLGEGDSVNRKTNIKLLLRRGVIEHTKIKVGPNLSSVTPDIKNCIPLNMGPQSTFLFMLLLILSLYWWLTGTTVVTAGAPVLLPWGD